MAHRSIALEAAGVESFAELYELPTDEVIRRLDAGAGDVLHSGDAFLAVVVLRGVVELRESTERLDDARRGLERWGLGLAVIATAATVATVVQALT
jgi:hypothetical protein